MSLKTIRRDVLARRLSRGELEARCDGHYTDDYAGDAASGFGKTDWMPASFVEVQERRSEDGRIVFDRSDLDTSTGRAYEREGRIFLHIHSNLTYELRAKSVTP